ncbi:MAG: cytochrome b/b6 domain-containing protein [Actinobacteria bacterium]|nr:cytochrome b/b6 domain-containing protein [Actinomycetota bacterium]
MPPVEKPAVGSAPGPAARPAHDLARAPLPPARTAASTAAAAEAPAPASTETAASGTATGSVATWVKRGAGILLGAIAAAGIIVLAARGVTTLPGVPEFLKRYPGEYAPAMRTEDGFPLWARWNHFFNLFLMVLIIRSGLLVRHQKKPPAFYTPKRGGKKISLSLWLHTSLDVLWLLNGAVFVVLLFASGHWLRIVPTSWAVFPNAASALLQYLTLDWPAEHAWANYNSLQQLMYFVVVFIAAPVAAITGVRMSTWWPEKAERLNRVYPAPVARAVHFPTMLFFVVFIVVHVFLVLATGALRNLNHMFAGTDEVNWVGFWVFVAGIVVTVLAWIAARPLVLAPIANLFGKVSNR